MMIAQAADKNRTAMLADRRKARAEGVRLSREACYKLARLIEAGRLFNGVLDSPSRW